MSEKPETCVRQEKEHAETEATHLFSFRSRTNMEPKASNWKLTWARWTGCGGRRDKRIQFQLGPAERLYCKLGKKKVIFLDNHTRHVCLKCFYSKFTIKATTKVTSFEHELTWSEAAWFLARVLRSW